MTAPLAEIQRDGERIGVLVKPEGDVVWFVVPEDVQPGHKTEVTFNARNISEFAGKTVVLVPVELEPGEQL